MARSDAGGYYEMGGESPRIRVQVISRWRKFPDIFSASLSWCADSSRVGNHLTSALAQMCDECL
jgi:hypothetical protein